MTTRIVVGVDGSPQSIAALRWAAALAARIGVDVDAVHAYSTMTYAWALEAPLPIDNLDQAALARETLERAVRDAGLASDVEVRLIVAEGSPARTLVALAADAELLVVGSRGLGPLRRAVVGSVGHGCIAHARCPVVVVPSPEVSERAA